MLTILIMMIKIRDYDDNDDCENDDDGDEGDSSCAGASYSCSASGLKMRYLPSLGKIVNINYTG